jgi:hypothetical protein
MSSQVVKIEDFGISEEFGYMQNVDPVTSLAAGNEAWDEMGKNKKSNACAFLYWNGLSMVR